MIKKYLYPLFSGIATGFFINYIVYAFEMPLAFAVLPIMCVMLISRFAYRKKERSVKYLSLIPQVVLSFLFFEYMYYRIKPMTAVAVPLTAVLSVWCVICAEYKRESKKCAVLSLLAVCIVSTACYGFIGVYYSRKADTTARHIIEENSPNYALAAEVDGFCSEADTVFYSSDNEYRFTSLLHSCMYGAEAHREAYAKLQSDLKSDGKIGIKNLLENIAKISAAY